MCFELQILRVGEGCCALPRVTDVLAVVNWDQYVSARGG